MENGIIEIAPAAQEFGFLELFLMADWVVKAVMGILVIMSVWSWAIAVDKWLSLRSARSKGRTFEEAFWSGRDLDSLANEYGKKPRDPFSRVFAAGLREWKGRNAGDRVAKAANAESGRELSKLEGGLGMLATIASSAPFIGLFGTVWGIMNSFRAIAASQDTNLAVVAPGIAEALFATALGLLAAVPAVIFFNALSSNLSGYATKLEAFVDELSALADRGED
ncbi:protein TolQ [Hyphobacterium sp. CCMP332]|jgi:biopolymer transport protein TolQ|uniref:protein TolQ n=1 Tax=Hyphobacterium sp. CCMP332 TaxID=2749086 RepID=UPI00165004E6|nr:protein TolQ [Hyphobacterium sp. CCMP332]QNL17917.1 protein TolQ [Hyphobacterium sp. CCMP332]